MSLLAPSNPEPTMGVIAALATAWNTGRAIGPVDRVPSIPSSAARSPMLHVVSMQIVARSLCLAFAVVALAIIIGGIGFNPAPRILGISGSPTPPEHSTRTVANTLGTGDFVTSAPDGEAHITIAFEAPTALFHVGHAYATDTSPLYRVTRAQMEWSDDGGTWHRAGLADSSEGDLGFWLARAGAHPFWRLIVVESGAAPLAVLGTLRLSTSVFGLVPVDLAFLALWAALLVRCTTLRPETRPHALFWASAACIGGFLVTYSFAYAPVIPLIAPDSHNYIQPLLQGTFNATRSSGYPIFVLLVSRVLSFSFLVWAQLLIQVLCYMLAVWLIWRAYRSLLLGVLLLVLLAFQGVMTLNAPQVLTEALFTAGLTLFAAALAASARQPSALAFALAGAGLVLAIAAKAIGVVLVAPALLLLRFLPREAWGRAVLLTTAPGLAVYLAMSAHGYSRSGTFAPEQFAGYALAGHVGWMLDGEIENRPGLADKVRAAAASVTAKRPAELSRVRSLADLDRYVNYTTNEYNTLLWGSMVPALQTSDNKAANDALLRLSLASIARHPLEYIGHVAAHFYGLWGMLGLAPSLPQSALLIRVYAEASPGVDYRQVEKLVTPLDSKAARNAAQAQSSVPLASRDILDGVARLLDYSSRATLVLGVISLLIMPLLLLPGRVAHLYRGEIMFALALNAYLLGQALFQVAMTRYSIVAFPTAILFTACLLVTLVSTFTSAVRRPAPADRSAGSAALREERHASGEGGLSAATR